MTRTSESGDKEANGIKGSTDSKKQLQDIMEGTIQLDAKSDKWQYVKDGVSFAIGTASDGIRKLGMLERLLENG